MHLPRFLLRLFIAGLPLLLAALTVRAEVSLPALFSTHAVLQKAAAVPVWGTARPGEHITVMMGQARATATAGADGRWRATLDLASSAAGPFDLVVKGENTLTVSDVAVGEVWLASGQSNMEWVVYNTTDAKQVIAESANPLIRQFLVKKSASPTPLDDVQGEWKVAGPGTTGGFTAVGYFFARALNQATGQAVGLLHASWGGTNVEAWTSIEGIEKLPELKTSTDKYRAEDQGFPARIRAATDDYASWADKAGRADSAPADALEAVGKLEWKPVKIPATSDIDLPAGGGVVWLRRTISVPASVANLQQALDVGRIDGFHTVYFNGVKVGEVTPRTGLPRPGPIYVKGELVKSGDNELAIRVVNPAGCPAIYDGQPLRFSYRPLAGEWQAAVERVFPELSTAEREAMPAMPIQPLKRQDIGGYLYNAMIHPLIPYGIRGVIWYQGESNGGRAAQYRSSFSNLITDWRERSGAGDFPFYFCQLANFGGKSSDLRDSGVAELREAQSLALRLPATGQAVLTDVGEADDIHPRNKRDVGERLARIAMANTYGRKDIAFSGPVYASQRVNGDRVEIRFTGAFRGLVAKELPATYAPRSTVDRTVPLEKYSPGSELQGFSICGADRRWVWAHAKIEGDAVIVWSPEVKAPVAVRYGWAGNPTCNLYDGAGLPASPFRTDDFPLSTQGAKY